jgi:hypothetical protein
MKKATRVIPITITLLSLAAALYAIDGHSWKGNPSLLRLKSNGEMVAELHILKGTKAKVEMNGQIKIKQVSGI